MHLFRKGIFDTNVSYNLLKDVQNELFQLDGLFSLSKIPMFAQELLKNLVEILKLKGNELVARGVIH